jgi:glycosyltransferase involved in cell wall biosynthesis
MTGSGATHVRAEPAQPKGRPMHVQPLISIVLPTHNGARYLDESIASCRNQTHAEWELIIVDDASTDGTPEIIARHAAADGRIRCIRHAVNCKLPGALNTGFAAARGEYLTWTSDDNLYRPTALAEMAAFLENNPQVDLVYASASAIDESGTVTGHMPAEPARGLGFRNVVGACFLYRRRVFQKLGGYAQDGFCAEDYDYWLRASMHFRLAPLERDLYLYRFHAGALTATHSARGRWATELVLWRHLPRLAWLDGVARSRGYLTLARLAGARHDAWRARLCALRAFAAAPRHVLLNHADFWVRTMLGAGAADLLARPYRSLKRRILARG